MKSQDNPADNDPILNTDLAPNVKAAALMFRDIAGRHPLTMIYPGPQLCPKCGDNLYLATITADWFPYVHVDYGFKCPRCDESLLHGLAIAKDTGLSLIIWDSNPVEAVAGMHKVKTPYCPYAGHAYMTPTKIFGDWLPENKEKGEVVYQWKCPECFLTEHQTVKRGYPRGTNYPLTDGEEKIIEERLRKLGYF